MAYRPWGRRDTAWEKREREGREGKRGDFFNLKDGCYFTNCDTCFEGLNKNFLNCRTPTCKQCGDYYVL